MIKINKYSVINPVSTVGKFSTDQHLFPNVIHLKSARLNISFVPWPQYILKTG